MENIKIGNNVLKHSERFKAVMRKQPVDRLPRIEWAVWWDKTIERWHKEGLPEDLTDRYELYKYFGLDLYYQQWIKPRSQQLPEPQQKGHGIISSFDDYNKYKKLLYPPLGTMLESIESWLWAQERDECVVWITLEGFFWWPRYLFGIEPHMYAFYDNAELMHQINKDLVDFNIKAIHQICVKNPPTFMTFAEDMSYNKGPMLSKKLFNDFIAPYYRQIIPVLKEHDIVVILDSDGDVSELIPWLEDVGVDAILPLEHQAAVDVNVLQQKYPQFGYLGNFDKLVMSKGKNAMREEFERLLPAIKRGRFIPSVDHQTPPEVSLEQYLSYLQLLNEYTI
jgi:hypothetical protein